MINSLLKKVEQSSRDTTLANTYNLLATEFLGVDDDRSKDYSFRALKIANELNDQYIISWCYNLLGLANDYQGNSDSALLYYHRSIEIKKKLNDTDGIGSVLMNIGVLYVYQNDFENAINYYNQAIEKYMISGNQARIGGLLSNIGSVYRQQGKYQDALDVYERALLLKKQTKDTAGISNVLGNLGIVYLHLGDYKKSEELQLSSMHLDSLQNNQYNLVTSFISLAELNLKQKKYENARNALDNAISLGQKINAIHTLDDAYLIYTSIDTLTGNFKDAYKHLLNYNLYHEMVMKEDRLQQMDRLEIVYDTKEKERKIDLLKVKEEVNTLKINDQSRKILIYTIVTGFLIILLVVVVFSYRKIAIKEKELQAKNSIINITLLEKEALLKEIHHRVKNNLQVISSLLSVQSRYITDEKAFEAIKEGRNRVNAMAIIHQGLYNQTDLRSLSSAEYITQLAAHLFKSYNIDGNKIKFNKSIEDVRLDIDKLIPIGLILNETISNALKHAFENKEGTITVTLKSENSGLLLEIIDDGKGLPKNFAIEEYSSLGMKLIKLFTEKLKGQLACISSNGTRISIRIPHH